MRTTRDIDTDVLEAAKERARRERKTAGQVVSELLRAALTAPATPRGVVHEAPGVYGFRPFSAGAVVVTNAQVDALRGQDAY
jgi:hypothetical protein